MTALSRLDTFLARRRSEISLVLAAGDITIPGHEHYAGDFISVVRRHERPLLLVHGNNDTASAVEAFRRAGVTIHRRERELLGHRFVGFGGDGTAPHDTELAEGESLELRLAGAIFLTHVPPGTRLPLGPDRPAGPLPRHAGQGDVPPPADGPRAHICGHIHSTEGVAYVGGTKIVKLRAAMWNRCALLDLDTLRAQFLDLAPGATRQGPRPSTRP